MIVSSCECMKIRDCLEADSLPLAYKYIIYHRFVAYWFVAY